MAFVASYAIYVVHDERHPFGAIFESKRDDV